MKWKELKIATLQKMFSAEGNEIPADDTVTEYIAGMPQAANEALQLLSTAGKYIVKKIEIAHIPLPNLISDTSAKKIHQIIDGGIEFSGEKARAYYFEFLGKGTLEVYVGDTLAETVELSSQTFFTPYRGLITNESKENVCLKINTKYAASVKNVALYNVLFDTPEEVQPYSEKIKYDLSKLAPDFYMLNSEEIYYEGENPSYINTTDFFQEGNKVLVLDRKAAGNYTVYYNAYPERISMETADDYELPLDPEVVALLPLYMASQLYKEDDISLATTYRNEFEVARELLHGMASSPSSEEFVSESGWC